MRNRTILGALCVALAANATLAQGKRGTQGPIPDETWTRMQGVSWHSTLPCPKRSDLRLLQVPYIDFNGTSRTGQLIVAREVAGDMLDIFAEIHAAGYPIQSMKLVHHFRGDDGFSMAANNTSAFNCRRVAGTSRLSQHALGRAIDINPVQNPFVTGGRTSPSAGVDFDQRHERTAQAKGVLTAGDPVVAAFKKRGWGWGGDWTSMKDYQHFSQSGN